MQKVLNRKDKMANCSAITVCSLAVWQSPVCNRALSCFRCPIMF